MAVQKVWDNECKIEVRCLVSYANRKGSVTERIHGFHLFKYDLINWFCNEYNMPHLISGNWNILSSVKLIQGIRYLPYIKYGTYWLLF